MLKLVKLREAINKLTAMSPGNASSPNIEAHKLLLMKLNGPHRIVKPHIFKVLFIVRLYYYCINSTFFPDSAFNRSIIMNRLTFVKR